MMMVYSYFEFMVSIFEIILSVIWGRYFLHLRFINNKTVILAGIYVVCAARIIQMMNSKQLFGIRNAVISILIIYFINFILYNSPFVKIVAIEGIYIVINLTIDFIVITLFSLMLPQVNILTNFGIERIKGTFISKVFLTLLVFGFGKYFQNERKRDSRNFWKRFSIFIFIFLITSFYIILKIDVYSGIDSKVLLLTFYFLLLLIAVLCFLFLTKHIKEDQALQEYMMTIIKNQALEKIIMNDERTWSKLLKMQHDFKHNLLYIKSLIDAEKNNELSEFIAGQLDQADKTYIGIKTGNHMLDIIINYYSSIFIEKDIHFSANLSVPEFFFMRESDLSTLFGNILENANDAVKNSNGSKEIWLYIKGVGEMTVIKCINTCAENANILETTKENKLFHGIGLKSIEQIVKKYNGIINWKVENRKFCLLIAIKKDA